MNNTLDVKTLETWLWEAACKIRGEIDAPKYKDYILPLIFLKRLSDVFDDEITRLSEEYGNRKTAEELVEEDHSLVWFYVPKHARWTEIIKQSSKQGEFLTDAVRAIARENPKLQGVIDIKDFNETASGQRVVSDDRLKTLIDVLNKYRLGLKDVEPKEIHVREMKRKWASCSSKG
ncbi:MAG: type I restriction-modification system subunit M N-terminal domain-containing protein, partial [Thermoplasmata archaeon]|nr:type I restriction-modification system subunit M N-terminal domain-containing protein [Thermoplasmata archaeon]